MIRLQRLIINNSNNSLLLKELIKSNKSIFYRNITSKSSDLLKVPLTSTYQIIDVKYIRGQSKSTKTEESKDEQESEKSEEQKKDPRKEAEELLKNIDPATIKKLRILMLVVISSTCAMSFVMMSYIFKTDPRVRSAQGLEPIEFETFISKYLPTGEIERIIYCPEEKRAVAVFRPDAIIDGQPAQTPVILIKFERGTNEQQNQFKYEVRHAEEKLGITIRDSLPIEVVHGLSLFKLLEMALAFSILAFLGLQYGRLLTRTILKKKAEEAAKKAKK